MRTTFSVIYTINGERYCSIRPYPSRRAAWRALLEYRQAGFNNAWIE